MRLNFKRREFTTKGFDPTVVVEYENKELGIRITEFQGIYQVSLAPDPETLLEKTPVGTLLNEVGAALHEALEENRHLQIYVAEMAKTDEQRELEDHVADAERKAGWDSQP